MDPTLRLAGADDFEFIHRIRTESYRDYVVRHFGPWVDEEQRAHLEASWDTRERWVIEVEGQRAGCLDVIVGTALHLGNIIVCPPHRGVGIATKVVTELLARAEQEGLAVELQVFKDNPAVRLYERLGFDVYEETDAQLKMRRDVARP
ncbi:MAG: GNAT family N-acetyltransferase [Proteobacteria bacterium]|nr:GNAT family N-acetyltransferase [Pseudomonadota bacterium]